MYCADDLEAFSGNYNIPLEGWEKFLYDYGTLVPSKILIDVYLHFCNTRSNLNQLFDNYKIEFGIDFLQLKNLATNQNCNRIWNQFSATKNQIRFGINFLQLKIKSNQI